MRSIRQRTPVARLLIVIEDHFLIEISAVSHFVREA
jgi:hypothetical protein